MILNLVLVSGLLITTVFTVLFFISENSVAKKYLTPIFLCFSFEIFCFYAQLHDNNLLEDIGYLLSDGFGAFTTPLMFLYIRSVTNKPMRHERLFFIYPVLNLLCIVVPISLSLFMKNWISDIHKTLAYNNDLVILPDNILNILFSILALRVLAKYQNTIKHHFSETSYISLDWLKKVLVGSLFIITIDIGTTAYEQFFGDLPWNIGFITVISLCFFLFYLGYHGLKQQKVIVPDFAYETQEKNTPDTPSAKERVYLKKFDNSAITEYKESLTQIMSEKKLFLKPDIVLTDLAHALDLTDKQTTELLNLELETSFYDFINFYRTEEVKTRISSKKYEHLTLLAIALDSGFQSKSSFNRVFKKNTGLSPSEYKKERFK